MKNINEIINNYLSVGYNSINPNMHDGSCKSNFVNTAEITKAIQDYETLFSDAFSKYNKIPVNHISLPYYFTKTTLIDDNNSAHEVSMLFLQTYLRSFIGLDNKNIKLTHDLLYKYFNNNQEILNLPLSWVLYLGGVYHFALNSDKSMYDIDTVYNITNNFTVNDSINNMNGVDIYHTKKLLKYPTNLTESNDGTQTLNLNHVRILNRSLINEYESFNLNKDTELIAFTAFNYNNTSTPLTAEVRSIYYNKTMPSYGYGIQNQFLNSFNHYLFGDTLDGLITDKAHANGLPYSIIGGDLGIIKPIKTYNSDIEFTAFYRTQIIGTDFSINVDSLPQEFENQLKKITSGTTEDVAKIEISKLFVIYSKLKVLYLNDLLTDEKFNDVLFKLCEIKILNNKLNDVDLCDFYHVVFNVFFSSYKLLSDEYITTDERKHKQSIVNKVTKTDDFVLQVKNNLPPYLYNLTGLNNLNELSLDKQKQSLFNFLSKIWGIEKSHLRKDYGQYNDRSTMITLYPSAGGIFFPEQLYFKNDNDTLNIKIKRSQNIGVTKNNLQTTIDDYYNKKGESATIYNSVMKSGFNVLSNPNRTILFQINDNDILDINDINLNDIRYYGDPMYPEFFVPNNSNRKTTIDELGYTDLQLTAFDNDAILKNSVRFFWFDNANFGLNLSNNKSLNAFQLDNGSLFPYTDKYDDIQYRQIQNNFFRLLDYGSNDYLDERPSFKLNEELAEEANKAKIVNEKFREQYNFNTTLDSIDLDKFEYFKDLFLNFSSSIGDEALSTSKTNFTLKSLIMSNCMLFSREINEVKTPTYTFTPEDITLLTIGNSMYNYDFVANSEISKIINSALTLAQYNRVTDVIKEFKKATIQVPNLTQYGQVESDEYFIQPHNIITSPEVMFSGVKTYDELVAKIKSVDSSIGDDEIDVYFFKKTYFGDNYVKPFVQNNGYNNFLDHYVKIYMVNNIVKVSNSSDKLDVLKQIVINFFKDINVELTENNFKYLLKPLRSYAKMILVDNNLFDTQYAYGKKLLTIDQIIKTIENGN